MIARFNYEYTKLRKESKNCFSHGNPKFDVHYTVHAVNVGDTFFYDFVLNLQTHMHKTTYVRANDTEICIE